MDFYVPTAVQDTKNIAFSYKIQRYLLQWDLNS